VLVHIPDKGHVTTRYAGWYANRKPTAHGIRCRRSPTSARGGPVELVWHRRFRRAPVHGLA
jgi:hypothetical protein